MACCACEGLPRVQRVWEGEMGRAIDIIYYKCLGNVEDIDLELACTTLDLLRGLDVL